MAPEGHDREPGDGDARASVRDRVEELAAELRGLRADLSAVESDLEGVEESVATVGDEVEAVEADVEDRTVHREAIEADLERYVRARIRRGRARGWGPYLVLLYGTAMTIGAFYFLSGGWAILAMVVVWLSTLGLYTLMVLVGVVVDVLGLPGRAADAVRERRS